MRPSNLIQVLQALQERDGWLSEASLRALSEAETIPLYRLQEVASFYPHFRLAPPPQCTVAVCRDATCHLAGGPAYLEAIRRGLHGVAGVEVHPVSCLGRCDHAPAACVDEVPVLGWTAAETVEAAKGVRPLPPDDPTDAPRRWPCDPYVSAQARYGVLETWLAKGSPSRTAIPDLLQAAGLRGMGGAGFSTGLKWRLVRDAPGPEKVAVVNADESEPGTFKDRVILEELPHLVLEGLLLGCFVAGAREAWVYIRHEYGREAKAIRAEMAQLERRGLLKALGVDLRVFVSPGGYILGEETALIEALEGKRGEPRNKPPYPTHHGVHGLPTLMNNVETFAYVPLILHEGPEAWKAHGVNGATGWKFISLSGDVVHPGVYCVPMGTTVRTLLEEHGGGMKDNRPLKAFCPGGASAPFLPAALADTPLDFDALAQAGSMLGSGAVFAVAEGTDLVDLAANVVRFFRNESCGKCVPCRVGTQKAVALLERVLAGEGDGRELDGIPALDEALRLTSICGLGQVALNPLTSVMQHFPDEVRRTLGPNGSHA